MHASHQSQGKHSARHYKDGDDLSMAVNNAPAWVNCT